METSLAKMKCIRMGAWPLSKCGGMLFEYKRGRDKDLNAIFIEDIEEKRLGAACLCNVLRFREHLEPNQGMLPKMGNGHCLQHRDYIIRGTYFTWLLLLLGQFWYYHQSKCTSQVPTEKECGVRAPLSEYASRSQICKPVRRSFKFFTSAGAALVMS